MREIIAANKQFILVILLAELVIVACLPLASMLDEHVDRQRPMYGARIRMAELQHQYARERGGGGLAVSVSRSATVNIGTKTFTPPSGVSVEVDVMSESYCVRASNTYGDETGWRCWDNDTDPAISDGYER